MYTYINELENNKVNYQGFLDIINSRFLRKLGNLNLCTCTDKNREKYDKIYKNVKII